ncbi:dehydrogenase [Luteitalea sp. TBR-22]|uniref:aldehyde dehydrogenase family protein n=1 Tax=Luteitalea sp. TBR-22 TaxID=2802971 RepID=UPI001AFBBA9A|nr:aldehyde dehydrogenase family protein [Luteitalea sp. TBR-22]BCS35547.1 dehydrogenase [Luteitalea sp. TBR-22]
MTAPLRPLFLAGQARETAGTVEVRSPYDGSLVAHVSAAGPDEYEEATRACVEAAPRIAALPVHERARILRQVSHALREQKEALATQIVSEAGKPLRDARTEVDRAAMTFEVAAEEARRLAGSGEVIPMDLAPHGEARTALYKRVPIGPVAGISPFNFPLNLVAHKLAPALAAGNPIVLKPASRTPLSALALADLMHEAGLPPGALSVLPMTRETGDLLVTDDRYRLLTFTGSADVGWAMKARAGKKKVVLELGGNAAVVIDEGADLAAAAERIATGGFSAAGQSCISVQRVYVHDAAWDAFMAAFLPRVEALVVGDPMDERTHVGPLITPGDVARIEQWTQEAVAAGATVLCGGARRSDRIFAPTVLTGVARTARVCADEAFAPVVVVERVASVDEGLAAVNDSAFGLQAGVFTTKLDVALKAFDTLEVGGVLVNDVPTWRIDHMPYGGVKDSGLGREGPRYAIEDMTELRLLVVRR